MLEEPASASNHTNMALKIEAALGSGVSSDVDWAIATLRSLGPEGDAIVQLLVRDEDRSKRRRRIAWFAVSVLILLTIPLRLLGPKHNWTGVLQGSLYCLYCLALAYSAGKLRHKGLAHVRAARAGPDTLSFMLSIADRQSLPPSFERALERTLSSLNEDQVQLLSLQDRTVIRSLLKSLDVDLVLAVLSILQVIGSAEDLSRVEALTKMGTKDRPRSVQAKAAKVAAIIRERLDRQRSSELLLRPAVPSSVVLLHPVGPVEQIDEALLLRNSHIDS